MKRLLTLVGLPLLALAIIAGCKKDEMIAPAGGSMSEPAMKDATMMKDGAMKAAEY